MYHEDKPVRAAQRYPYRKKKPPTAIKVIEMQSPVKCFTEIAVIQSSLVYLCLDCFCIAIACVVGYFCNGAFLKEQRQEKIFSSFSRTLVLLF